MTSKAKRYIDYINSISHIQLGLRKGMAVLVYYRVQGGPHANQVFQAVLIAHESAATRGKNTENRLWKRVVPSETEFAWLPPDILWRSLHATPVFYMKNDPRFGGRQS